ncbi:MAG: DUF4880 domain-containing protein [Verrucomicrobia bacterium]|nr:DUF4880 domain-containing protein [Verrucomicrobiota bacterium]MBM3865588.1 DUF4880 domain-containing protein [Verrucomicrobiota bacterium]
MNPPEPVEGTPSSSARAAAEWVLRHDRGFTAAEQDAFSQWLAASPDHRAAWAEQRWGWEELDRLAGLQASVHAVPDPDLLAGYPPPRRRRGPAVAAAVAVAVLLLGWRAAFPPRPGAAAVRPEPLALIERRDLPDGSAAELNRGAELEQRFTPAERRVVLRRGEAHFTVIKDPARPFVVEAAGVSVRAVGTAFNVRIDAASVDVLVTEGRVAVVPVAAGEAGGSDAPGLLVAAGEKTVVALAPAASAPGVQPVSAAEIGARLAWQPRLLDFTNTPLPEILAEFNRCNPVRLVLGDPRLATFRLSAAFRSDNVEGFLRLLISDFGLRSERGAGGEIVLSRAP